MYLLEARDPGSAARAGSLQTAHGQVPTPIFMPVGTLASVKALPQQWLLNDVDAPIILANTYHLYLRPGLEVLEAAGGIHQFMHWPRALLTDSGGYQVYSLAAKRKITPEGVTFASHIDGSSHMFTPQNVVDRQRSIGSDILMVLDECTPFPCDYAYARASLALTQTWAAESRAWFLETAPLYGYPQYQFGIVQGSVYSDLRRKAAEDLVKLDFDGYAIGGLAVGEPEEMLYEMTGEVCARLPEQQARYLMGVGTPTNILEAIDRGVDMMDCVLPSRNARHGLVYSWDGIRNLKNEKYRQDFSPLDPLSSMELDQYYTKAYIRHLLHSGELLGLTLTTVHNLHFFLDLVRTARQEILAGTFRSWKDRVLPALSQRI